MTDARRPRFLVRRLPDTRGRLRSRRQYEVACFEEDADTPTWVRRTEHPGSVLRSEGQHPTDIHDHLAAADAAWTGGVGPWRSAFPREQQLRGADPAERGHRAADHGMPRLRVRRLPDQDGKRRRRRRYEVELTKPGAERPAWTRETSDPVLVIDPFLGVADAHAVVSAADRAWQGGTGPWESLFPGDRVAQDEVPGTDAPDVPDPGR